MIYISPIATLWRRQGEDYIMWHWTKWWGLFALVKVPTFWVEECTYRIPKVMDWVLASLDFAKCYIDDIIVFNSTIEEHNHHLQHVFDCLGAYGLKLHLGKCELPIASWIFGAHDLPMKFGIHSKGQGGCNFQGSQTNWC